MYVSNMARASASDEPLWTASFMIWSEPKRWTARIITAATASASRTKRPISRSRRVGMAGVSRR